MTRFLPSSHVSSKVPVMTITGILVSCRVRELFLDNVPILNIGFQVAILLSIACFLCWQLDKTGLYIVEQKIYYRGLLKSEIDIEKVGAIKVSTSARKVGSCTPSPLFDKHGNTLLSMSFLKPSDAWKQMDNPDKITDWDIYWAYREDHICTVIYDQSVLDFLLTLNPNIYIIQFNTSQFKKKIENIED